MKVIVQANELCDALKPITHITSVRSTLPIFASVLLEAEAKSNTITITATDGDQTLRVTVPAVTIEQPGKICANAAMLQRLLNGETGEASIEIDTAAKPEDTRLLIKTDGLSTKLAVIAADEFPEQSEREKATALVSLKAADLAGILHAIKHGASTDETRYILNGVGIAFNSDGSEVYCGDGRRIAFAPIEATIEKGESITLPIHTKSVGSILRLLDAAEGNVELVITGGRLSIDIGDFEYACKLTEGTYPNVRQVIPDEDALEHSMALDSAALKAAIQKCMPIAVLNEIGGKVTIEPEGLSAIVSAEDPCAGSVKIDVPCKTKGTPQPFSMNGAFLLQVLSNDTKDEIIIRHQDAISPQVVTGALATHIIMPICTK